MTTLYFWGLAPQGFLGGIKGSALVYSNIVDQHRYLAAAYRPPAVVSTLGPSDGTGGIVTSASYVEASRFWYPGNADNRQIAFTFEAFAAGGTGTIRVTVDGTDQGTVSVSGPSSYSVIIAPTTSTDPSEILVEGKVTAGSMTISALRAQPREADASLGVAASGWTYADGPTFTAAGAAHASERWARLLNGPRLLAKDRRACVVSLVDMLGAASSRSPYASNASGIVTVARFRYSGTDAGTRDYLVAAYFEADGGVGFAADVSVGSQVMTATGTGWTTATMALPAAVEEGAVKIRITSGSGYAYLRTLQIIRKV